MYMAKDSPLTPFFAHGLRKMAESGITNIHTKRHTISKPNCKPLRTKGRPLGMEKFASLFAFYSICCIISLIILVMENIFKPSIKNETIDDPIRNEYIDEPIRNEPADDPIKNESTDDPIRNEYNDHQILTTKIETIVQQLKTLGNATEKQNFLFTEVKSILGEGH